MRLHVSADVVLKSHPMFCEPEISKANKIFSFLIADPKIVISIRSIMKRKYVVPHFLGLTSQTITFFSKKKKKNANKYKNIYLYIYRNEAETGTS